VRLDVTESLFHWSKIKLIRTQKKDRYFKLLHQINRSVAAVVRCVVDDNEILWLPPWILSTKILYQENQELDKSLTGSYTIVHCEHELAITTCCSSDWDLTHSPACGLQCRFAFGCPCVAPVVGALYYRLVHINNDPATAKSPNVFCCCLLSL
jgi:hypothetical protein